MVVCFLFYEYHLHTYRFHTHQCALTKTILVQVNVKRYTRLRVKVWDKIIIKYCKIINFCRAFIFVVFVCHFTTKLYVNWFNKYKLYKRIVRLHSVYIGWYKLYVPVNMSLIVKPWNGIPTQINHSTGTVAKNWFGKDFESVWLYPVWVSILLIGFFFFFPRWFLNIAACVLI